MRETFFTLHVLIVSRVRLDQVPLWPILLRSIPLSCPLSYSHALFPIVMLFHPVLRWLSPGPVTRPSLFPQIPQIFAARAQLPRT